MGLFDFFRRPPPVATWTELVDFLDAQSSFLTQKGMFEYSRARAGPYGNILFDDKGFLTAVERSRWIAYPVTLAMVAEAVEGELRPAVADAAALQRGIKAAALEVFDRFPAPQALTGEEWKDLRTTLAHDLDMIGLHPVKRVMDVPARFTQRYAAAMPIHEKLRAKDDLTIHNFLRSNLCNIHEVFARRADRTRLPEAIVAH